MHYHYPMKTMVPQYPYLLVYDYVIGEIWRYRSVVQVSMDLQVSMMDIALATKGDYLLANRYGFAMTYLRQNQSTIDQYTIYAYDLLTQTTLIYPDTQSLSHDIRVPHDLILWQIHHMPQRPIAGYYFYKDGDRVDRIHMSSHTVATLRRNYYKRRKPTVYTVKKLNSDEQYLCSGEEEVIEFTGVNHRTLHYLVQQDEPVIYQNYLIGRG